MRARLCSQSFLLVLDGHGVHMLFVESILFTYSTITDLSHLRQSTTSAVPFVLLVPSALLALEIRK
jgi:hypothetical protein